MVRTYSTRGYPVHSTRDHSTQWISCLGIPRPLYIVVAAAAFLPVIHDNSANCTFEESCSAFASEVEISNVKVHFSQYLPVGYNLSIPDYVSLQFAHPRCFTAS